MDEPFRAVQFTLQYCPFWLDRIVQDQFELFHITVRYVSTELRKLEGRNAGSHEWRNENRCQFSGVSVTGGCALLTRALYWFMIMTAGLCLGPMSPYDSLWSEHIAASLNCVTRSWFRLPPPTVCIEHVTGKPAQYPQRMWKVRRSAVGCSQVCRWCWPGPICLSMSEFGHVFSSSPQGDKKVKGCFYIEPFKLQTLQFS